MILQNTLFHTIHNVFRTQTVWTIPWIIKTGVTWGWGRFGRFGFLGSLFWSLSSRSFKQLTLHVSFFHISTGLSQNNYTIQHFQCYQSAESEQIITPVTPSLPKSSGTWSFRYHSNMLICCSRNIFIENVCWKQLCCLIFLWKPWYFFF